jgi:hypothetical protein
MAKAATAAKDQTSELLTILAERTYKGNWDKITAQINKLSGKELKPATVKRYAAGYTDGTELPAHIKAATMTLVSKKLRVES